jgi:hypothetical protein
VFRRKIRNVYIFCSWPHVLHPAHELPGSRTRLATQPQMGVTRDMVVSLLRSTPTDLLAFRNKNVVNTLTIGCMLPAEGAAALTCELVFNSDYRTGLHQYRNCATLHCLMHKNDQEWKGHQMRFGVSTYPALVLPFKFQLGLFMDLAYTRPRTNCNGHSWKRCTVYPLLLPKQIKTLDC